MRIFAGEVAIADILTEGRLILADALSYSSKHYDPEYMIDFATLTGAVVVALGHVATGIMGTDEALVDAIKSSSKTTAILFGVFLTCSSNN